MLLHQDVVVQTHSGSIPFSDFQLKNVNKNMQCDQTGLLCVTLKALWFPFSHAGQIHMV